MEIVISNILLTRRCPYKCSYCRIVKDYENSPYPNVHSYTELSAQAWMDAIKILEDHGCVFHTIYGGEPIVYKDMDELIRLMTEHETKYTFITSGAMPDKWLALHKKYGIKGISSSVDIVSALSIDDRAKKSSLGKVFLSEMKQAGVDDVVAVTVLDEKNIHGDGIFNLVKELSSKGIVTEITTIDEPKSEWYDFAEKTDLSIKSYDRFKMVMDNLKGMKKAGYLIHNNEEYFVEAKEVIDSEYRCKTPYTSLTIEPDGTLRLCYRIGGKSVRVLKVFDLPGHTDFVEKAFEKDRKELCKGCLWNCIMMSEFLTKDKVYAKKVFQHNQ